MHNFELADYALANFFLCFHMYDLRKVSVSFIVSVKT